MSKHYIAAQIKTEGEGYCKRKKKRSNMWTKSYKAQVHVLFVKDEVITNEKENYIQRCICTAASQVSKNLKRKKSFKERVKEINNMKYCVSCQIMKLFHSQQR